MDLTQSQKSKTRKIQKSRVLTRRRLVGGQVKVNTDAATAILQPIYNELPQTKANGDHNLTYGEIEWPTLKYIMDQAKLQAWSTSPGSQGKFYDLGSGRGRAVLYAALSGPFDQSIGIEILPERISLAQAALTKLKQSIPTIGSKVRFIEGSFLNPALKYKDARAIFISNLCLDIETQNALFNKLNAEMPKDSLLFCTLIPTTFPSAFEEVTQTRMPMTWTSASEFHVLRHL
jgi:SAM-dependent methyltransferase